MEDLSKLYLSIGAGGLCLISTIAMFWYYVKQNNAKLEKMLQSHAAFLESLNSFAKAIGKMQTDQITTLDAAKTTNTLLDRSQSIIENNTKAMENFSQTLNNFSNYLQSQDDKLKNLKSSVKHLTRDNAQMMKPQKNTN